MTIFLQVDKIEYYNGYQLNLTSPTKFQMSDLRNLVLVMSRQNYGEIRKTLLKCDCDAWFWLIRTFIGCKLPFWPMVWKAMLSIWHAAPPSVQYFSHADMNRRCSLWEYAMHDQILKRVHRTVYEKIMSVEWEPKAYYTLMDRHGGMCSELTQSFIKRTLLSQDYDFAEKVIMDMITAKKFGFHDFIELLPFMRYGHVADQVIKTVEPDDMRTIGWCELWFCEETLDRYLHKCGHVPINVCNTFYLHALHEPCRSVIARHFDQKEVDAIARRNTLVQCIRSLVSNGRIPTDMMDAEALEISQEPATIVAIRKRHGSTAFPIYEVALDHLQPPGTSLPTIALSYIFEYSA